MSGKTIDGIFIDGIWWWEYVGEYPNTTPSSYVQEYVQRGVVRRVEEEKATRAITGINFRRTKTSVGSCG